MKHTSAVESNDDTNVSSNVSCEELSGWKGLKMSEFMKEEHVYIIKLEMLINSPN